MEQRRALCYAPGPSAARGDRRRPGRSSDDRLGDEALNWQQGNATEDGRDHRGWLLGHFIDPAQGVRSTKDVEVRWGVHPAGEKRSEWTSGERRTTLILLVEGHFRVDLTEGSVTLAR